MDWTHDALAHDLCEFLRNTRDVIAWEDMQMGPSGSLRPDVFTMPKSYAKFRPMVYEVKVSVADFRSDITKGKWQGYLNFSCGVVFAAPRGLISKDEIPSTCGMMVRGEDGWRMAKGPTLSPLPTLPRESWIKLLIDGSAREGVRQKCLQRASGGISSWEASSMLKKQHGAELAELVAMAIRSKENVDAIVARNAEELRRQKALRDKAMEDHRRSVEYSAGVISAQQGRLAKALGLDSSASQSELIEAIREATNRLANDGELKRMRRFLESIKDSVERGLEKLPGENA